MSKIKFNTLENLTDECHTLVKAKAKDEAILASIGDGLVATGKDGNIMLVNRAFESILGWKESEVQGKFLSQIVPIVNERGEIMHETELPIIKALRQNNNGTTTSSSKLWYKRKDGSAFPVAITVSPIILKGKIVGVVEVFRDITKEKQIDKAKSEFVSLASHQLRTPLTAINWYVEMLQSGDVGKLNLDQKKYLEEIYKGSVRMVELVNDLLNISRIETGRLKIEPKIVDLAKFIEDIVHKIEPWSRTLHREIIFKKGKSPLPQIAIDATLTRQVIHNIITNAVRYSPETLKINITLEKKADKYLISVSDEGIGIPVEAQARIFEKFFRADNARMVEGEGSGIGLYISKLIADVSGGKLWCKSPTLFKKVKGKEVGYGTNFYFSIPVSGMKKHEGEKGLT